MINKIRKYFSFFSLKTSDKYTLNGLRVCVVVDQNHFDRIFITFVVYTGIVGGTPWSYVVCNRYADS